MLNSTIAEASKLLNISTYRIRNHVCLVRNLVLPEDILTITIKD